MQPKRYFRLITLVLLLGGCTPIPPARPESTALNPSTAPQQLSPAAVMGRMVEAVQQPGKVFHVRLRIEDSDMPDIRTAEIWFDGERPAGRRQEHRNGELIGVTVREGWESAYYEPQANQVYTSTVPTAFRSEGVNPALDVFSISLQGTLYSQAGGVPPGPELAPTPTVPQRPEIATKVAEKTREAPGPASTASKYLSKLSLAATPVLVEIPAGMSFSYALILSRESTVIRMETSPMVSGSRQDGGTGQPDGDGRRGDVPEPAALLTDHLADGVPHGIETHRFSSSYNYGV
jgi:hypothetical protein